MASQGSAADVRIFSSVRPLQIQRSFEDPSEVSEVVGSVTRDVKIEEHSSVAINSQTSSSPGMSAAQPSTDGGFKSPTSPVTVSSSTVVVKTGSSTSPVSPTTPGTIVIRNTASAAESAAGASSPPAAGGQNVVIIKSLSAVASTGPAHQPVPVQSSVVIKSAGTQQQLIQPNSPSKIVINPAPIVQSRITIGASPVPQPQSPVQDGTDVEKSESTIAGPVTQARRSSPTIKAAPSSSVQTPVASPAANLPDAQVANGPAEVNRVTSSDNFPPSTNLIPEHKTLEPPHPVSSNREDLSEKIHPKKPAGPSVEEILEKVNISSVFYVAFAVLMAVVLCILGEGEIPLSWILTAISGISLISFIALRL